MKTITSLLAVVVIGGGIYWYVVVQKNTSTFGLSQKERAVVKSGEKYPNVSEKSCLQYSRDGDSVFVSVPAIPEQDAIKIEGADTDTFQPLRYNFSKDKNSVFAAVEMCGGLMFEPRVMIIEGADTDTFEVLISGYAKDKNSVFFSGGDGPAVLVEGADSKTFEVIGPEDPDFYNKAKDKNSTFWFGRIDTREEVI
ncbi:MAG: DKNYY domain-containing protein [bacterium]|nr:DKNYY domain-containing protein [bacterium]